MSRFSSLPDMASVPGGKAFRGCRAVAPEMLRRAAGPGLIGAPRGVAYVGRVPPDPDACAYPGQWLRLHWWAWRISRMLDGKEREIWDGWRSKWTPWV